MQHAVGTECVGSLGFLDGCISSTGHRVQGSAEWALGMGREGLIGKCAGSSEEPIDITHAVR